MTRPVNPYPLITKNEGSTVVLSTTSLDKTKALITPTTLSYRIDDLTNNREVLDWTSVSTPASTNDITVTAAQNALYGRTNKTELRQITTKTVDSSGNTSQDEFYYSLTRIFTRQDQLA